MNLVKAISGLSSPSDSNTSEGSVSDEERRRKTYLRRSLLPLVERSHEKGAYLDPIKSEMRGSRLGLGKGDDHSQWRQGKWRGGVVDRGQRGWEPVSGMAGYGGNINLGLV